MEIPVGEVAKLGQYGIVGVFIVMVGLCAWMAYLGWKMFAYTNDKLIEILKENTEANTLLQSTVRELKEIIQIKL